MKRWGTRNKFFAIHIILGILIFSTTYKAYAMEIIGSVEEEAGTFLKGVGIEEGSELFTSARDAIMEKFGNLSAQEMEDLGANLRGRLLKNIEDVVKSIKAQKAELEGLNKIDLKDTLDTLANTRKMDFFNQAKSLSKDGFSLRQGELLEKVDADLSKSMVDEFGQISQDKVLASNRGVTSIKDATIPVDEIKLEDTEVVTHESITGAQKELQDFLKNPGEISEDAFGKKIEEFKTKITDAKGKFDEAATKESEAAKTKITDERLKEVSADAELKDAQASGQNVEAAKAKLTEAKSEVAKAEKAARQVEVRKAYQEYEQAQAAEASAKQELDTAKKLFKGDNEKIAEYEKTYNEAQAATKQARDAFIEKHSWFEKGWGEYAPEKIAAKLPALGEEAWAGVKGAGKGAWWGVEKAWGSIVRPGLEGFFQAGVFLVPQMMIDKLQAWLQSVADLDTLRTPQVFGGVIMKQPDSLIDEAEPRQSKFVYVGIPKKDQQLTEDFLKTANYYVSKSEYGDLASFAITDPTFPHVMLHLNTGFVFVGDGVALKDEDPTVPLLKTSESQEQPLRQSLDDLAGEVRTGSKSETVGQWFSLKASGYAGDPTIADLFETPIKGNDKSYSPVLQRLLVGLQSGTEFGEFLVQGIRGLDTANKNDIAMWNLISQGSASTSRPALDEPYTGLSIYIYQTKDTPFIQNISSSLTHDDVDAQIAAQNLADYVVMLDESYNPIPLQTPRGVPPYNYAAYILNPDVVYMISLLDPSLTLYAKDKADWSKSKYSDLPSLWSDLANTFEKKYGADSQIVQQLFKNQVAPVQQFIEQQAQYGPFSVGAATLYITKDLIAKGIYIYRIPDYLGKGIDDYVIALDPKKGQIIQLPMVVPNFVSLVTSRIYDGAFKQANVKIPYYVMQNPDGTQHVTTDLKKYLEALPQAQQICPSKKDTVEKSPLYTLFVESALNPTRCEGKPLPTQEGWALQQYGFVDSDGNPKTIDKDLLTKIKAVHDLWVKAMEKSDPSIIARQMGPFKFTLGDVLQDVEITAVNEAAVRNQNFVYYSDSYPDEYLVLATDAEGAGVGNAYDPGNPQRYAVSLSNGYVYSALAQEGKVAGERVDQKPLDLQKLLAQAQTTAPFSPELLAMIQHSEKVYNARIARDLYGVDNDFAQFKLYIAKEDYLADQYIYADVTHLGAPLDQNGEPISAVVSQITDYLICIERTASPESCVNVDECPPVMDGKEQVKDKDGKPLYWHYSFANKISGNTYAVASLITGATYDRNGSFLGSYGQFLAKGGSITDIAGFTSRMFVEIKKKSGQASVRLQSQIMKLLQNFVDRIKQEEKELAEAGQEINKLLKTNMSSNLKQTLDTLPYIDNPNLLPRYLKYHSTSGKYFSVTPGYLTTPKPTDKNGNPIDIPSDGPGPDRTYVDYNVDVPGASRKDSYGMIYNSDGGPVALLGPDKQWIETSETDPVTKQKVTKRKKVITGPGWALQLARAYAGVNVDATGKQTRSIGITTPSIPFGDKPGTTNYLIPTGFDAITDSKHNTTFEFFYHSQIDSFFVKITPPTKQSYYLNLTSGYSYTPDGNPRWFENQIFSTGKGDLLFIGYDQFDILKVALYNAQSKAFAYYTMVGSFKAQIAKSPYNAIGTYCTMVNDNDPDSKIQLFQATQAATQDRAPLAQPYYLVWDVSSVGDTAVTQKLLGQFIKNEQLAYSLLLYAQTRNKGDALENGKFIAEDNYIDVTAEVKKPKTIGIVYDKNRTIKRAIYEDQLCDLVGSTISVKGVDGTVRKVQVTQNKKNLGSATTPALKDLSAQWISFEDGSKIYDYEYDVYILDPQPQVSSDTQNATHLNLYNLKHGRPSDLEQGLSIGGFGLNVTPYVPTLKPKSERQQGPKTPISGVALASYLNAEDEATLPAPKDGFQKQAYQNLQYISVDSSGELFINNVVNGPTKRFVYRLGQKQDEGKSYATPGMYGWYIDLSNGITYDAEGFPTGISLNALQLLVLLDTLQLSVTHDKDGKPQLTYRMSNAPLASAVAPKPKVRAALKRAKPKKTAVLPVKNVVRKRR